MFRSLCKRVEVVTSVVAKDAKETLWEILDICLRDRRKARVLSEDGAHAQLHPGDERGGTETLSTDEALMELARRRAE